VNLERSLAVGGRYHGHMVLGHADGTAEIVSVEPEGVSLRYTIRVPQECLPLLARKGSVAIDGISLTIASVQDQCITVAVVPETQKATTLANKKNGSLVNIECDVLARYVLRCLQAAAGGSGQSGTGENLLSAMERLGF
jgi:riboflavin synthase